MIIAIGTFIGVLAIVLGTYWAFVVRPETVDQDLLEKRMRPEAVVRRSRLSAAAVVDPLLQHPVFRAIDATITRSGLRLTLGAFLMMSWVAGFVAAVVAWRLTTYVWPALIVGAGALTVPLFVVRYAANKRMLKFEEQFPEAIELIARALRAGHAFTTSLSMAAEEIPSPVGPEFKLLYDRQNFGMLLPDALRAFAERTSSVDTRFFVTAVLTQREAGGNLSGVLDNLASVIRDRFNVKRQVRVGSAHGRMTATFLMAVPPAVAGIQLWLMPKNMMVMLRDPIGLKLLGCAAALQVMGMLIIRRISKVEY